MKPQVLSPPPDSIGQPEWQAKFFSKNNYLSFD